MKNLFYGITAFIIAVFGMTALIVLALGAVIEDGLKQALTKI